MEHIITNDMIAAYAAALHGAERAPGTIAQYRRGVSAFARWIDGAPVTDAALATWREHLREANQPVTVNAMLAALNGFFRFAGWTLRAKFLKIQRRLFREPGRELTRTEYDRLLRAAQAQGRERLALLMETICATGIRVSEVRYITAEAVRAGRAEIALKGKIRTILLPRKLCRKLEAYVKRQRIRTGEVFRTRSGRGISRRQIWAELKNLCRSARVAPSKVFPHNLRHLFATIFYRVSHDIVRLADVLGHSSIETTRIYLVTSGAEHRRQLERMRLIQ